MSDEQPRKLLMSIRAVAAALFAPGPMPPGFYKKRYSLPPKSPIKLCVHCKRPHETGKPFCSAECCRAERTGEPRPAPPTEEVIILTEFPDASSEPPTSA